LLAGIDAVARASRTLVGVDGSATVKWSFGNGSMHAAPMGSQRCSVVGTTFSAASATAGADAFGGTDVDGLAVFFDDPELLHEATTSAVHSATPVSRDRVKRTFVDIVSP
jgi:hypothetical protein